jgi:hypothetical protein
MPQPCTLDAPQGGRSPAALPQETFSIDRPILQEPIRGFFIPGVDIIPFSKKGRGGSVAYPGLGHSIDSARRRIAKWKEGKGKVIATYEIKAVIAAIGIDECARESGFDRKNSIRKLVRGLRVKRSSYEEFVHWLQVRDSVILG